MTTVERTPIVDELATTAVGWRRTRANQAQTAGANAVLYAASIGLALLVASLLVVAATDSSPWDVYSAMYEGSLSRWSAIARTLNEAAPVYLVALGAIIAGRSGTFNIGNEGQLLVGGTACAFVLLNLGGPRPLTLPFSLLAGAAAGGAWAGIAALLRYTRRVDVVISTLLLNFVALQVVSLAVNKPWLLQESTTNQLKLPQSDQLAPGLRLPSFRSGEGTALSSSIFIAAIFGALVVIALNRTRWGFHVRLLGLNPIAARSVGVRAAWLGGGALMLSGAFAGLAGGVLFTGTQFRIVPGFSLETGYNGLLVALISRRNAVAAVPWALFFGVLRSGGNFLSATGVPTYITGVVKGLVVLAALLPPVLFGVWKARQATRIARQQARTAEEAR